MTRFFFPAAVALLVVLGAQVQAALNADAAETYLKFGGDRFKASLNRDFPKICSFNSVSAELQADEARRALKAAKKGDKIGELRLVTDGESFPYSYRLGDTVLANVLERSNGTARLTLGYTKCEQVRQ